MSMIDRDRCAFDLEKKLEDVITQFTIQKLEAFTQKPWNSKSFHPRFLS